MQLITLTTDFGTRDWLVGTMKGVILGIAPHSTIVDLTHEIPARDIRAGAFALMVACRFFGKGAVHVAVVDPGVGGPRPAIAVRTENYCFVGPDNGVLSFALAQEKIKAIHQLTEVKFFLNPVSRTFHGRDLFAPVAAHLSRGIPIRRFGPARQDYVRLEWPQPQVAHTAMVGEIVYLDRFGNAITNIAARYLPKTPGRKWAVFSHRRRICLLEDFYQAVSNGKAVAVIGSSGFLEVAINGGSAARRFGFRPGDAISVRDQREPR